jgi:hypothetical protein
MFFFIDSFDKIQSVEIFPSIDKLARHVLSKLGVSIELGTDPIQLAKQSLGPRGKMVNLAGAFKLIADSEDKVAQELVLEFRLAVERYRK